MLAFLLLYSPLKNTHCETLRGESRPSSITSPCFSLRILLLVSICTVLDITGRTEWSSEVEFYIKHSHSRQHRCQRNVQKEALELQQQQQNCPLISGAIRLLDSILTQCLTMQWFSHFNSERRWFALPPAWHRASGSAVWRAGISLHKAYASKEKK